MSETAQQLITSWILHGTPVGFKSNATNDDPAEFVRYANFHGAEDTHIEHPSKPGEKFIKETLPSGYVAYTFVRTGIYQETSDREGSNYAALSVFIPKNVKISNQSKFEQKLKQILETNVLNLYTYPHNDSRKWVQNTRFGLFDRHEMDAKIGESLKQLLPYLSTTEQVNTPKATVDDFSTATEKLKAEIREHEKQLAIKRAQLENMQKQS